MNGTGEWIPYIAKKFIRSASQKSDNYLKQLEENNVVKFIAEEWNRSGRKDGDACVECLEAKAIKVLDGDEEWFNIEKSIPGQWKKWTNNAGFIAEGTSESLLKFAKFSYDITGGYLMATDLQGTHTSSGYHLTDPAVLCPDEIDRRFGITNFNPFQQVVCLQAVERRLKDIEEKIGFQRLLIDPRARGPATALPTTTRYDDDDDRVVVLMPFIGSGWGNGLGFYPQYL